LIALAGMLFLVFLAGLRERLGEKGGTQATIAVAAGVLYVGLLFAAVAAVAAIPASLDYQKPFTIDPGTGRLLLSLAFSATYFASVPAAAFVAASSTAAQRSGVLPAWLVRAGYAVGVLCVIGLVLFPVGPMLAALWTVPVSVLMLRGRSSVTSPSARAVHAERA